MKSRKELARRSVRMNMVRKRKALRWTGGLALFCLIFAGVLFAQWPDTEGPRDDTKFSFARVFYDVPPFSYWGPVGAGNGPAWSHDWPRSETHLMKIMAEVTKLDPNPDPHIFSFKNDDCYKYPIAYLCEVGYIDLSPEEAHRMSEYLLRGGFLIVDDFRGYRALENFKQQMKTVFPDRSLEEVPRTDSIWTCFYDISKLFPLPPYNRGLVPQYLGMRDDSGRLMMIVDFNNDISEYWEWSDNPFYRIEDTNEAYKYGVNYLMYALTH